MHYIGLRTKLLGDWGGVSLQNTKSKSTPYNQNERKMKRKDACVRRYVGLQCSQPQCTSEAKEKPAQAKQRLTGFFAYFFIFAF